MFPKSKALVNEWRNGYVKQQDFERGEPAS